MEDDEIDTHSLLAITPAVRVEPLFPPHPTSITLLITNPNYTTNHFDFVKERNEKKIHELSANTNPNLGTCTSVLNSYFTDLGLTIH